MNLTKTRSQHRRPRVWRPDWERLESRLALSTTGTLPPGGGAIVSNQPLGPNLTVVATSPADGAILTTSPTALIITFDRPVDPFSLFTNDIHLARVDANGNLTYLWDDFSAPSESLDSTDTQLIVPLSQPLTPGHYQIFLSANSMLAGQDFSSLPPSNGSDTLLAAFTMARPGITLNDATALGLMGPTPMAVPGTLDFTVDPAAVKLYRFELSTGHFWRLGAEVTAQRNGSPLDSALTLFDAQGHVIATTDIGRPDFPNDPYLFTGLPAGTYYLGVSGHGNLPGQNGGYDPALGIAQSDPIAQASGPFTLHVVADPADHPTTVESFQVNHADPNDPTSPTGFTIQFSGPLSLNTSDPYFCKYASSGVQVVDQYGKVWSVFVIGYNESQARLTYILNSRLPVGHYTVRIPSQGGLTDLAGLTPVAPGQPAGVLGRFDVVSNRPDHASTDLGSLFPDRLNAGVTQQVALDPGESITYRFVMLDTGRYRLQWLYNGGSLGVSEIDPTTGAANPLDPGIVGQPNSQFPMISGGVHLIRFQATGNQPVVVSLVLSSLGQDYEQVLLNGVGQGPALNLRLIAPSVSSPVTPSPSPSPTPWPVPSPSPPMGPTQPGSPGSTTPETGSGPGQSHGGSVSAPRSTSGSGSTAESSSRTGLLLTFGGQPVGRAIPGAGSVSPVGPSLGPNAVAVASAAAMPPQSIDLSPAPIAGHGTESWANPEPDGGPGDAPTDGALIAGAEVPIMGIAPGPIQDDADILERLRSGLAAWLSSQVPLESQAPEALALADPHAAPPLGTVSEAGHRSEGDSGRIEQAGLASPFQIGLAAYLVIQSRTSISRWLGRRARWQSRSRSGSGAKKAVATPNRTPGPHRYPARTTQNA